MVKRFVVPFASAGDKTVAPDAADPSGAISYSQGWPVAYQLDDTDPSYRPVGRQEMNGVLNDITAAIGELQTIGFPEWVAVAGLVVPYRINAYVRHNDVVWRNTLVNNSDEPGVGAGATSWQNQAVLPSGLLLRRTLYRNTTGTLQVSVDGAAFTNAASAVFAQHPLATFAIGEAMGGGGGGGNAASTATGNISAGPGGSEGGYALKRAPIDAFHGATITVGQGGAAATNGGSSSISGLITANGGFGGSLGINAPISNIPVGIVSGGTASGGDINATGQVGQWAFYSSTPQSGTGGGSRYGGGPSGVGGVPTTGTAGTDAFNYGTGGSGAANGSAVPTTRLGGKGFSGLVIIEEFS